MALVAAGAGAGALVDCTGAADASGAGEIGVPDIGGVGPGCGVSAGIGDDWAAAATGAHISAAEANSIVRRDRFIKSIAPSTTRRTAICVPAFLVSC
ncbi:MAG TPA: hypothetical protein VGN14_06180 [Candidatus Elarobacter sp.]